MKLRLILTVAFALTVVVVPAKDNKKEKKTSAKKTEVVKASKQAKVDTVSVKDFSFDMGVGQVNGLKRYLAERLQVDTVAQMPDFLRGLQEMFGNPTDKKLTAYSAGLQIGGQLINQFLDQINEQITGEKGKSYMDVEQYKKGFIAGITGKDLPISVDSASTIAGTQMNIYKAKLNEQKYGANRKAGEAWLAENAKKSDVKKLPSGVQYKVITAGNGPKPTANSTVKVNYEGKTIDGTVFDSSYKRNKPMTFKCSQVIKGWSDAIQQMPVGSTWEIYIPQELGYGSREAGQIKPYSTLIFKVELLSIEPDAPAAGEAKK